MEEVLQVPNQVSLKAMRRTWWIAYKWICIQEQGEVEPVYVMAGMRPIEGSLEAAAQFDEAWRNYHACTNPSEGEGTVNTK